MSSGTYGYFCTIRNNPMNFPEIFRSRLFPIWLLLACSLYFFSLWHRQADIDDAWIGEHAYWLAKEGHVRSELMRGITQQEDRLVVHHKLLNLHGALFIKMFGFSINSLKSVSLTYFVLFCFLFFHYLRTRYHIKDLRKLSFIALLLLSFPWVFKYSFVYRPEMMIMAIGFAGWIFLEKTLASRAFRWKPALLSGLLAGLCFAVHLNGAIVPLAGFIMLIINKRHLPALVFAAGSLAGAAVYFYDFSPAHGLDLWLTQFNQSPSLGSLGRSNPLLMPLINLLNEHQRFFHNPMIAFSSIFIIFSLITGYNYLKQNNRNMIVYTLLLVVFLGMLAMHKSRQYILIYFPFVIIMVSDVYLAYFSGSGRTGLFPSWRSRPVMAFLMTFFLMAFLISGFYFNLMYSLEKFTPRENALITEKYISEDPSSIRIIAPMTFIFNEIEKFERIQSDLSLTEMMKSDPSMYGSGMLEKTKTSGIRYIILEPFQRRQLGWERPEELVLPQGYIILSGKEDDYLVIKHTE